MNFNPNYKEIGIMGDTHGDLQWVLKMLTEFNKHNINVILHLGDFGVWPNHEKYLIRINQKLKAFKMIMIVTLGNHENYARLEKAIPSTNHKGFNILKGYENILFAQRGQRWEWEGVNFVSLGGANSIDRFYRTPNVDWWDAEQISLGDVYRTIEGGKADIMLTHDAPAEVPIIKAITEKYGKSNWPPEALMYAEGSRMMLSQAVHIIQPKLLLHGHYHILSDFDLELTGIDSFGNDENFNMRSICFDKEGSWSNIGILELPSMEVRHIENENLFP